MSTTRDDFIAARQDLYRELEVVGKTPTSTLIERLAKQELEEIETQISGLYMRGYLRMHNYAGLLEHSEAHPTEDKDVKNN